MGLFAPHDGAATSLLLLLLLGVLLGGGISSGGLQGGPLRKKPPEHFLLHSKGECFFLNGTQRIRLLNRFFWGQQEVLYFDSDLGRFVAVTELGRPEEERFNQDQNILRRRRAQVDHFCRRDYQMLMAFIQARQVQPRVKITFTNQVSSSSHNTLLICDVTKFFPSKIEIKWLKNGKELEDPVWSTDLIRNGDWTFQIHAMLEIQPERGDIYACWVNHASFKEPVTIQWEAQSDAARSKMWTGVLGIILGLVFVTAGLALYLCSKKGFIS